MFVCWNVALPTRIGAPKLPPLPNIQATHTSSTADANVHAGRPSFFVVMMKIQAQNVVSMATMQNIPMKNEHVRDPAKNTEIDEKKNGQLVS